MDVVYPFTLKFMFISSFEGLLIKLQEQLDTGFYMNFQFTWVNV